MIIVDFSRGFIFRLCRNYVLSPPKVALQTDFVTPAMGARFDYNATMSSVIANDYLLPTKDKFVDSALRGKFSADSKCESILKLKGFYVLYHL